MKYYSSVHLHEKVNRMFLIGMVVFTPIMWMVTYLTVPIYADLTGLILGSMFAVSVLGLVSSRGTEAYASFAILLGLGMLSPAITSTIGAPAAIMMIFFMTVSTMVLRNKAQKIVPLLFFISIIVGAIAHYYNQHLVAWYAQYTTNFAVHVEDGVYSRVILVAILNGALVYYISKQWQKSAEQAEHEHAKLVSLQSKQEEIYAIIGHELRTPASAIHMLLSNIMDYCETDTSKSHIQPYCKEAFENTNHLLSILDDMKISNDKHIIKQIASPNTVVKVYHTLQRSINGLLNLAEKYEVNIELRGTVANKKGHMGSPKAIQQVVQNIVKNAILHAECDHVIVDMTAIGDEVKTDYTIDIIDNGKGIDEDYREVMWDPFTRGKSRSGGTGLGLSICRDLARSMPNGNLIYIPREEGGSIFRLTFTLLKVLENEDEQPDILVNHLYGKKVLFVEDTSTLRMLGKVLLEKAGAEVVEAINGIEGIKEYEKDNFDIILTDIMMPDMNGYQMTKEIRSRGYAGPIIGVTGATVGQEADRLISSGANYVVSKPMKIEAINTRLTQYYDSI